MLDIDFSGTASQWMRLAEILGTESRNIDAEGLGAFVTAFVAGQDGHPLDHREMEDADAITTCPVAYALARAAGYDPAGMLLLRRLSCNVTVRHPFWPSDLDADLQGSGLALRSPIARGAVWRGTRGSGYDSEIRIDPRTSGLPETVVGQMADRMRGRHLRETVSNPILDAMDLRVTGVAHMELSGIVYVRVADPPKAVSLAEAVGRWEDAPSRPRAA